MLTNYMLYNIFKALRKRIAWYDRVDQAHTGDNIGAFICFVYMNYLPYF